MNPINIQIIGFVGMMCIFASFQKDTRSFTLLFHLCAAIAFGLHFIFLGAWTGAAMNGLAALRAVIFQQRDHHAWLNNKFVMLAFVLFFWIAGLLTWDSYLSILPVISMTLECFALWSSNTRVIRWLFLSARPGWIGYDYAVGSYAGLATEALIVGSILIAIVRFDVLKKKES